MLVIGAERSWGPVSLYLALAGVGTIGIVDFDVVDLSNLQRQVLHRTDDVQWPRSSRRATLLAYNPGERRPPRVADRPTTRWS